MNINKALTIKGKIDKLDHIKIENYSNVKNKRYC